MTPTAVVTTDAQERILDAALGLVARWGVTKTTVGDVARAAGIGRATLYRAFPGGKEEVFAVLAHREVAAFFAVVAEAVDAAPDLGTALVDGLHAARTHLDGHDAIRYVLEHEPELAVPVLGFEQTDRFLRLVQRAMAPHLVRFLPADQAAWAAEWLTRTFLSALVNPTPEFDLSDRDVCARIVTRYVLPALEVDDESAVLDLTTASTTP